MRPLLAATPEWSCIAVALVLLLCSACRVERALRITSQPAGAEVRLDGEPVGRTPLKVPFNYYGTRRVTLYLDGYLTESRVLDVEPPWYGRFPLDIVTEVLLPIGWKDIHKVHAELAPGAGEISEPDLASVLRRAEELRRAGPDGPRPQLGDDAESPRP